MRSARWLLLAALLGCDAVEALGDSATDTPEESDVPWTADSDHTDQIAPADPLASEDFAFCHEAAADADQAARWCELLDEAPPEVCPGLRATCESGTFRATPSGCAGALPGGGGWGSTEDPGAPR